MAGAVFQTVENRQPCSASKRGIRVSTTGWVAMVQ
jgi:hypothetical protein